ncbi:MAG: 2Fe-2S iron-sulfur cluster binding domain-containing protein [Candidatus Aminicenantes bacterium]|nr:2Fe-2S iron-sulfur cluster binding domain-containing protein [Candidatus Aminicenantes bacterium]
MVEIFINDRSIKVPEGITVLKAAERAGIHIPHICYHEAFAPEGSCRMCLVEIEGHLCLELACATQVKEGMKVFTETENVRQARQGVLEFLLAEHPMDCPICDKAGECTLQDYYEQYGLFESTFMEQKERKDKNVPLGKGLILDRERCVLCTRCVRFLRDITQTEELGVFERGVYSEIGIFDQRLIDNNYAGNLTELCPVGAITDKDFRFKTRNWFLEKGASICPLCSRGCNIFIEHHPGFARFDVPKRVYRITSRVTSREKDQKEKGYWICDIGRYGYSYMDQDRAEKIVLKQGDSALDPKKAVTYAADQVKKLIYKNKLNRLGVISNTWLTNEELFLVKKIFTENLESQKVFFPTTAQREADDLLLTSDRTPNKKGAQEIGFSLEAISEGQVFDGTELLFVFWASPFDLDQLTGLMSKIKEVQTKILFTPFEREWNKDFDLVIPTAVPAEKAGSFTNEDERIQHFGPVLYSPGQARAEWEWLVSLGKEIKVDFKSYARLSSPFDVFQMMKKKIKFFGK